MTDDVDILDWYLKGAGKVDNKAITDIGMKLTDPLFFSDFVEVLADIIKLGKKVDEMKKHLYYGKPSPFTEASCSVREYSEDTLDKADNIFMLQVIHGMIGLATETGEFAEEIKKVLFQGKSVDYTNFGEELGDTMWYVAKIANTLETACGISLHEWLKRNHAKLEVRYAGQFTEEKANNRNLDKEREKLEGE